MNYKTALIFLDKDSFDLKSLVTIGCNSRAPYGFFWNFYPKRPGIVDTDWYVKHWRPSFIFNDREEAIPQDEGEYRQSQGDFQEMLDRRSFVDKYTLVFIPENPEVYRFFKPLKFEFCGRIDNLKEIKNRDGVITPHPYFFNS